MLVIEWWMFSYMMASMLLIGYMSASISIGNKFLEAVNETHTIEIEKEDNET